MASDGIKEELELPLEGLRTPEGWTRLELEHDREKSSKQRVLETVEHQDSILGTDRKLDNKSQQRPWNMTYLQLLFNGCIHIVIVIMYNNTHQSHIHQWQDEMNDHVLCHHYLV